MARYTNSTIDNLIYRYWPEGNPTLLARMWIKVRDLWDETYGALWAEFAPEPVGQHVSSFLINDLIDAIFGPEMGAAAHVGAGQIISGDYAVINYWDDATYGLLAYEFFQLPDTPYHEVRAAIRALQLNQAYHLMLCMQADKLVKFGRRGIALGTDLP